MLYVAVFVLVFFFFLPLHYTFGHFQFSSSPTTSGKTQFVCNGFLTLGYDERVYLLSKQDKHYENEGMVICSE